MEIGRGQSGVDFRHIAHMGGFVEDSGGYVLPGRSLTARPGVESRSLIGLLPRLPSPTEQSPSGAAGAKSMHNRYQKAWSPALQIQPADQMAPNPSGIWLTSGFG